MSRSEVETCLTSTGEAKYALTRLNGREQRVLVYNASHDGKHYICRTPAGNDVYRTARQLEKVG